MHILGRSPPIAGIFAGLAFNLISFDSTNASDLPWHRSAPTQCVQICDAYGSGFIYLPGTETCLKVGGLALAEMRSFDAAYSINGTQFYGNGVMRPAGGYVPTPGQYSNARSRDAYAFAILGRVELDARTRTEWGVARTFMRIDAYYGSGQGAAAGSLGQAANTWNGTAGTTAPRETTIVNKAFVQFAGLTAGRAQSFFDFYADAYNFANLRGSNATVSLLAYTAPLGGGWSSSISLEDQPSRRAAIGSTIAGYQAQPGGVRIPDIVGSIRFDQDWGAFQFSAAGHQIRASLFQSSALSVPPSSYAFPKNTANEYGFAVQSGLVMNMESLAKEDKLWLQGAYENGAISYIAGNNIGFSTGAVSQSRYMGSGFSAMDNAAYWNPQINSDCVFTGTGFCELQWGWAFVGAYKHYWLPSLSSALYASYAEVHYSANALAGLGDAIGVSNTKETRIGVNLIWTPLRGFDIGAELMYINLNQARPIGLASNNVLTANGLPVFKSNATTYEGRIRIQRAF